MGEMMDAAQAAHLARSPWMTTDTCTCRTDQGGGSYYVCRRKACDKRAKVCGGSCPKCFAAELGRPRRPEVVVLCGSTKFYEAFQQFNYHLTMQGKIVLSIGCDTKSDEGLRITAAQKAALDELHKRKIDMADRVLVLNVGGYIGESTRSEIEYAEWWEKPINYLEEQ